MRTDPWGALSTSASLSTIAGISVAYTARSSDGRRSQSTPSRWIATAAWSIVEVLMSIACLIGASTRAISAGATPIRRADALGRCSSTAYAGNVEPGGVHEPRPERHHVGTEKN